MMNNETTAGVLTAQGGNKRTAAASTTKHRGKKARAKAKVSKLHYTAPDCLSQGAEAYIQPCGDDDDVGSEKDSECPICFCGYDGSNPPVMLSTCSHRYHRECLMEALKRSPKCPTCRQDVIEPQGTSPSGTMKISTIDGDCNGYPGQGTIVIDYNLHGGDQKIYHENPGVQYYGEYRQAYLPNNEDGRDLLKRLEYAFGHGLTFTVGTSLTTGRSNVVTWSSIHHKTCRWDGPHGFPDPNFFMNCNEELDCLGVPAVIDLE